jgi:putative oxidoreductase
MGVVILVGRMLFGTIFLAGGIGHFTHTAAMTEFAKAHGVGVKLARPAVLVSGAVMTAAAAMVALGVWADLGAFVLVVLLLPTAVVMHPYWRETDPQAKAMEQIHFNKDISLVGAALMVFGFVAVFGSDLAFTLTPPLSALVWN